MTAMALQLNSMLGSLDDTEIGEVIKYVEYIVYTKQYKTGNSAAEKIQNLQKLFATKQVWTDENEMLKDLADFRRGRAS